LSYGPMSLIETNIADYSLLCQLLLYERTDSENIIFLRTVSV